MYVDNSYKSEYEGTESVLTEEFNAMLARRRFQLRTFPK